MLECVVVNKIHSLKKKKKKKKKIKKKSIMLFTFVGTQIHSTGVRFTS